MAKKNKLSIYISFLLRHEPWSINLDMDVHGWVTTEELIEGINNTGKYQISMEQLEEIVDTDNKGRYRFNADKSQIKACQGHSIPWVIPELEYRQPPEFLYHGTTMEAKEQIFDSGYILKMERHAVHMQEDAEKSWKSAMRWKKKPVVLKIAARKLYEDGVEFGVTENEVWCAEKIPVSGICEILTARK